MLPSDLFDEKPNAANKPHNNLRSPSFSTPPYVFQNGYADPRWPVFSSATPTRERPQSLGTNRQRFVQSAFAGTRQDNAPVTPTLSLSSFELNQATPQRHRAMQTVNYASLPHVNFLPPIAELNDDQQETPRHYQFLQNEAFPSISESLESRPFMSQNSYESSPFSPMSASNSSQKSMSPLFFPFVRPVNAKLPIHELVNQNPNAQNVVEMICSENADQIFAFLKTKDGSDYARGWIVANEEVRRRIADLVIKHKFVKVLSCNMSANFVVQELLGISHKLDVEICEQLAPELISTVKHKYGCRVMQAIIKKVHPEFVKSLFEHLKGYALEICKHEFGNYVVQRLVEEHKHGIYEKFFWPIMNQVSVRKLVQNVSGTTVVRKLLENLAAEVTDSFVPQLLNSLILWLLQDVASYICNPHSNYIIQFLLSHPAFKRQRDFIIDNILLGKLLILLQDKYASHVVEIALKSAGQKRVERMCEEVVGGYKKVHKKTALDILFFDQYGNYAVQIIIQVAIEVAEGKRRGNKWWLKRLSDAVIRNENRLELYTSGKLIIKLASKLRFCSPPQCAVW